MAGTSRRSDDDDDSSGDGGGGGVVNDYSKSVGHHRNHMLVNGNEPSYARPHSPVAKTLIRTDLISAMKLPDSEPLTADDYWIITDTWKPEWERGVEVPYNTKLAEAHVSKIKNPPHSTDRFTFPKKLLCMNRRGVYTSDTHQVTTAALRSEQMCNYDLDELDSRWLNIVNGERALMGCTRISELEMERTMEELEKQSWDRINTALKVNEAQEEQDDSVICDVCRSPDSEECNEMVFCDKCNICVHQACYGITNIPSGSWLCKTCSLGIKPKCELCPNRGGAMKATKSGQKWAHVSCALWIPEVSIGCVEKMEPITKISKIPPSRWNLVCVLCKERVGSCIQCSVKTCKVAYHVTCAFKRGLEMRAIIEDENADDGVKLRSYCQRHSLNQKRSKDSEDSDEDTKGKKKHMTAEERSLARRQKIIKIESEFFKDVDLNHVSRKVGLELEVVSFINRYWILKRRSGGNRPLLLPRLDDPELSAVGDQDNEREKLKKFVALRQDLERVRNLCYMVSRREKLQRSFVKHREQILEKQLSLLADENCVQSLTLMELSSILEANHGASVYDRVYSHSEAEVHTENDFEIILARISGEISESSTQPRRENNRKFSTTSTSENQKPLAYKRIFSDSSASETDDIFSMSASMPRKDKKHGSPASGTTTTAAVAAAAAAAVNKKKLVGKGNRGKPKKVATNTPKTVSQSRKKLSDNSDSELSSDIDRSLTKKTGSDKRTSGVFSDSDSDLGSRISPRQKSPVVRTKAAMKDFSVEDFQRARKANDKASKPKPSQRKKSSSPSKSKKKSPVLEASSPESESENDLPKSSKKKSDSDFYPMIVPERAAARRATAKLKDKPSTEGPDSKQTVTEDASRKVIAKHKKIVKHESELSSTSSDEAEVDTKKRKILKKNSSETDERYGYVPQRKAAQKASAQMKDVDRSVSRKEENLLFGDLFSNKPQIPQKKSSKKKIESVLPPLSQRLHSDTDSDEEPFRQRSPRGHKSPRGRAVVPRSPRKTAKKSLQQSQPPIKKGLSEKAMSFLKGRESQLDDIFKECGFGAKSSNPEQSAKSKIPDSTQVVEKARTPPPPPPLPPPSLPEVKPSKQTRSSSSSSNSSSSSSSSGSSSSDSDSENRVSSSRRRANGSSQLPAPSTADLMSRPGGASSSDKLQAVKPKPEETASLKVEEDIKENQAPLEKIRTPRGEGKHSVSQVSPLIKSPPMRSPSLTSPGLNSSASPALGSSLPLSSPQVKSVRSTPSQSQLMSPNFVEQSPRKSSSTCASSLKNPTSLFPTKSPGRQMLNDSTNDLGLMDRLDEVESESEKSTSPIPGLSKAPTVQETLELVKSLQRDFAEELKGTMSDTSTTNVPQISPCLGSEGGLDKQRPAKQTDEGYVSSEIANTEQGIEFAKLPVESPSIPNRAPGKDQLLGQQSQQSQQNQYSHQNNQQVYNQEYNQHVNDPNWHLQQTQSLDATNQEGLLDLYRKFSAGYTGSNLPLPNPYEMGIQSQLKQWQNSSQYDMIYQQSQYNNYLHLQQIQQTEYQKQFLEQLVNSYNQPGSIYNFQMQQFGKNDAGQKHHKSPTAAHGHSKYHSHQLQPPQHSHHSRVASSPLSGHDDRVSDLHRTPQNKVQSSSQPNQIRPAPLHSDNRYSQSNSDHQDLQRQHFLSPPKGSQKNQGSSDTSKHQSQQISKESLQKQSSSENRLSFQLEQAEKNKEHLQQYRNHLSQMIKGDQHSSIPSATPVEKLPGFVGSKDNKAPYKSSENQKENLDTVWRSEPHRDFNKSPVKLHKSPEKLDGPLVQSSPNSRPNRRASIAPHNDKNFDDLMRKAGSTAVKFSEGQRSDLGLGRTPTNSESHDQSISDMEKSDYDETNNKGGVDYDDFYDDEDFVPSGKSSQTRASLTLKAQTSGRGRGKNSARHTSAKVRGRPKSKAVTINTKALAQVKKSVAGTDYDFEDEFGDDFGDQDKPEVVSLQELREQSKKQYLPVYSKEQTENSKSVFQDFSDGEDDFGSPIPSVRGRGKRGGARGRAGIGRGAGRLSKVVDESLDTGSAKVQKPSETGKLKLTLNIGALMNRKDKSANKKRHSSKESEIKVPKITIKLGPKPEESKVDSAVSNAGFSSTRDQENTSDQIYRSEETVALGNATAEETNSSSNHKKTEDDSWYLQSVAEKKKQSPAILDQYSGVDNTEPPSENKRSPLIDPTSPSKRFYRPGSKHAKTPPEIESVFGPSVPLDIHFSQPNIPPGHHSPAGFTSNSSQPLDRGEHRPSSLNPLPETSQDKSELELIQEEINLMDHKSGASPHAYNVQGPIRKALNAARNVVNSDTNFDEDDGSNRPQHLKMKFKLDEKHTSQADQSSYGSSSGANLLSNPYNSNSMMLMGSSLTGSSTSGSVNSIRRMRKKELLNQYYGGQEYSTAPVNGPSSVSSVTSMLSAIANEPIQAMQQQPVRNIIKMPKAVASVTSVPTRADYQQQLEANLERKRKRDKGLTDASKPFEIGANKFQEKSGKKKKGRGKQNDEDIEYKPKSTLEASQEEEKKENARKTRGKPPKKCLAESPPHEEMTAGDLKAENMKYAEQIRAQFDKDPGQSGSGGSRGKQRKRRRDDDGVAITNAKAPRIVIKFSKGPQEDPLVTEHRDHLSVENLSTGRNGLDEYDFDGYTSQKVTPLPIVDGTADHYSSVNSSPAPNDVATKVPKLKIKMQKV